MSQGKDPVPVLVVEDNQRYGELIERMLGGDFASERASTLGDAVAAIQQGGSYGCILLDLLLPGTDRLEASDAVRAVAPECPIVVLTNMEDVLLAGRKYLFVSLSRSGESPEAIVGEIIEGVVSERTEGPDAPLVDRRAIISTVDEPGIERLAEAESEAVARDLDVLARVGGRLHVCHVSTAASVEGFVSKRE